MSNLDAQGSQNLLSIVLEALQALSVSTLDDEGAVRCTLTAREAHACETAAATASLGDDLWRQGEGIALSFVCIKRSAAHYLESATSAPYGT